MNRTSLMSWSGVVLGLVAVLALAILCAGQPEPSLGAPIEARAVPSLLLLPHSQGVTCTLYTTTTDPIPNNRTLAGAVILADYTGLTLVEGGSGTLQPAHEDYFRLDNAVPGWTYEVYAVPDGFGNYNLGMVVYNASQTPILTDTNTLDGPSTYVRFAAADQGPYYFKVFQVSPVCSGGTFRLDANGVAPTPTPTSAPVPSPTPLVGADRFEPNYDFDHATIIGTDITYDDLNFVPWGGGAQDNDFYKLWVKPGLFFTCETLDLAPGVDTNMILYDGNRNAVGGNDDVALGDYRSRFSYFSTYEGYLYVLVGHGGRLPVSEIQNSTYGLRCTMETPGLPTSTPHPTATPELPESTPTYPQSPLPTPAPSGELSVRTLSTPMPPAAAGTPTLHFVPVDVLVYYDVNNDRAPGAGEGVAGILIQAYDTATGEQVAQGFTDGQGRLQFTSAVRGTVRLSIPYLGLSRLVGSEGASVYVRIAPQPLPDVIP